MIFLLTDGETSERERCLSLAEEKPADTTIHTFGVGNDCDRHFVTRMAELGEGTHSLIGSHEVHKLRSTVIQVLSKTLQPSYKEVKTRFSCKLPGRRDIVPELRSQNITQVQEISRYQLYSEFFVLE